MAPGDRYRGFGPLTGREREGRDFDRRIEDRASAIVIVAPHGGGIEPGTSEIARALAGREFSLYSFEGRKPRGNQTLHVTSTRFDDPACVGLVERARTAVAIHGCDGSEPICRVGGRDTALRGRIVEILNRAGFPAEEEAGELAGLEPANICNRGGSGMGVQLEISHGMRMQMFQGLLREERDYTTAAFGRFVGALRTLLLAVDADPGGAGGSPSRP